MKNLILFRLDAGDKVGMGHLSRCIALYLVLKEEYNLHFLIKTDNINKIKSFLEQRDLHIFNKLNFLDISISESNELKIIVDNVRKKNAFLIIDHYAANENYQYYLYSNKVKWLQFDSHGKIKFYANLVLHASPGATYEMYNHLKMSRNTRFLLGTKYAIINSSFKNIRHEINFRTELKTILICFGGGSDQGFGLKCLELLESNKINQKIINFITSKSNPNLDNIKRVGMKFPHFNLILDSNKMHKLMAESDLGIIPPGTLSYEAASVGLPMILITIADNQNINATGWNKFGAAISLGNFNTVNKEKLNSILTELDRKPFLLKEMSLKGLNAVDGNGPLRTKKEIKKII